MTEQQQAEGAPEGGTESKADGFKPITSQEDLNAVLSERLSRERAKFSDYGDLKSKAAQLDALAEASTSEQEKLQRRIEQMEERAAKAEVDALRSKYAADVPEKYRALLTGSTDEELSAQRDLLAERDSDRKKNGNRVPNEGTSPKPAEGEGLETVRALFGGG